MLLEASYGIVQSKQTVQALVFLCEPYMSRENLTEIPLGV
jgi:hypothetical protein